MGKKLTIEFIRAEFAKEGYTLLTKVYENAHQKLEYICSSPEKHKHSVSWSNWNSSKKVRCPYCVNKGKPIIEFIRADFAKEGYTLLTRVYKNSKQKLEYICSGLEKHRHSVTWGAWNTNKCRCPYCVNVAKPTIEYIRSEFKKEGYTLLTIIYENAHQKLDYICPRGHRHSVSWNNWNSKDKRRCPYCVGLIKPTIEFIRADFAKEEYTLLTIVYENNRQKLKYKCPIGHIHNVTWGNWKFNNRRCPKCNNSGVSKWEKAVKKFLDGSDIDYVPNDRTQLLNPETGYNLELDIWFSDLNKAIECNGVYWYKRRKHNDKIKQQLCKDQGIDLLVITDEEWNKDTDKCKRKLISFIKTEV